MSVYCCAFQYFDATATRFPCILRCDFSHCDTFRSIVGYLEAILYKNHEICIFHKKSWIKMYVHLPGVLNVVSEKLPEKPIETPQKLTTV